MMDLNSKDKSPGAAFLTTHKSNIALWSGFVVVTMGACVRAFGFAFLIFKAFSQRSVAGLSLKTLELYAFVFFFRLSSILRYQGYLPYDRSGDWLYSFLEIVALSLCCGVIYLVTVRYNSTYELRYDTFGWLHLPSELGALYILLPCVLFGMGGGAVESCISHFVYALAFGSFLHLVFWFSSYHELGEKDAGQHVGYTVIFVQIGHMLMMADFLYYYFKSMKEGGPMMLPTHGAYQV
uniref:ER lumen protein-retaining receptor n=1 Tax=Hyaloperonospora arabidopsidis (strain Emoy2) TaxID=559515 RepID=M4C2T2_HYAAE